MHMQKTDIEREIKWLLQEKYDGILTAGAREDIKRLGTGEPIDYVIGWSKFLDCTIDLGSKPLIPRPETEEWVRQAIVQIKQEEVRPLVCLDIFAGSGCIGIAVLAHIPWATMDVVERESKLLPYIAKSFEDNHIAKSRYSLIISDIFSNVRQRYDYVFANPPYVAYTKREGVQESVLIWEPESAVFGGDDGFLYISPFIAQLAVYLKPKGKAYIECDPWQQERIHRELVRQGLVNHTFHKDQFGLMRYVMIHNN